MNVYQEFKERGLLAQSTNEEAIAKLLENEKVTFYAQWKEKERERRRKGKRPGLFLLGDMVKSHITVISNDVVLRIKAYIILYI